MIAVGLMSGTSLDGIDAALVHIEPSRGGYAVDVLAFATTPFEDGLLERLHDALPPNAGSAGATAALGRELGDAFAACAARIAGARTIDFVASHGQTLWHDGARRITLQAGDPFAIREAVDATVVFDFRSADLVAGGCGAPLVPYVDALLFGSASEDRIALNVGGIANLTFIPKGTANAVAFDSGPGNMLIDAFVRGRTGNPRAYDTDGALAAAGTVDGDALGAMLRDPYFALEPPKSTGRERFGAQFLQQHADALERLSLEDGAATLTALTAQTIAAGIRKISPGAVHVLVSGGGAHNATLLALLAQRLEGCALERSDAVNVDPDAKEAVAFAVLGYETLRERCANIPRVTGARHPVVLGAIAPRNLRALLARVEAECG